MKTHTIRLTTAAQPSSSRPHVRGFTLVELLVVITIIAVLAGLGFAGFNAAMKSARKTKEISGAKTLIAAYLAYPLDNAGALMLGYDKGAGGMTLPNGQQIDAAAAHRYPYRLAEYFGYNLKDTVLTSRNAGQVNLDSPYEISLFPAMGINSLYLGGHREESQIAMPAEVVTLLNQATYPLLAFASTHYAQSSTGKPEDNVEGFHMIEPPRREVNYWASGPATETSAPRDYGYVDARYGGKAVCAFLDGAVRLESIDDLRDMRLWNINAAASDNPDYQVQLTGNTGRGGTRR